MPADKDDSLQNKKKVHTNVFDSTSIRGLLKLVKNTARS